MEEVAGEDHLLTFGGFADRFFHLACERDEALFDAVEVLLKGRETQLPAGITFVSSPDCTAVGSDITCNIGMLDGLTGAPANQKTVTINVVANHTTAGACVNVAVAGFVDPTLEDNDGGANDETASASVDCKLAPQIDLELTKIVDKAVVAEGDQVIW